MLLNDTMPFYRPPFQHFFPLLFSLSLFLFLSEIFITRRVKIKSDLLFETTHRQTTIHRIEIIPKKKTVPFEVFYLFFFLNFLHFFFDSFSFYIQTFIAVQNEQLNNSLEKNPSTSSQREREKGRKEALSSE